MNDKHARDWDRRIQHNYRLWMSDGIESDEQMFATGERDLNLLVPDKDTQDKTFLEVGCGVGRLLAHAAKRFKHVIGVDISESALNLAQKFLAEKNPEVRNYNLILTNDFKIAPVPDSSVDIVGSFATLFSVPTEVLCGYLLEASRVLKPGGKLAVQLYVGAEFAPDQSDSLSLRSYSKAKIERALKNAGFDQITFQEDLNLPVKTDLESMETKAVIVRAVKTAQASASLEELAGILRPETVYPNSEKQYELAMYYDLFKRAVAGKKLQEAKDAAEMCVKLADELRETEISDSIKSLLKTISSDNSGLIDDSSVSERKPTNLVLIDDQVLQFRKVGHIMVPYYKGHPLSNPKDPERFELNLAGRVKANTVVIFGVGVGVLAERLIQEGKRVYIIEPIDELRRVHEKFSKFFIQIDDNVLHESEFALVVNPCYMPLFSTEINQVKELQAGFKIKKRFTVAVVSPIDGGSYPISRYAARAFAKLGYRVLYFDFSHFQKARDAATNYYLSEAKKNQFMDEVTKVCATTLLEACKIERPQVVLALSQAPITASALEGLRREGIVTAMWFVEDFRRFSYWQQLAGFYDYFFVIQKEPAISEIRKLCRNVKYVPVACDPEIHKTVELTDEEMRYYGADISFMGYGYPNRVRTFARFGNYNFKIWGKMWPPIKPFKKIATDCLLPPEEYVKIFQASKINLNLHSSTEKDFVDPFGDFVNPRTFEIAGVGAFQLCDKRSLLPELFGETIPTFETVQDLKDKIDYYLAKPDERSEFASKSNQIALARHTYLHRAREMMQKIVASDEEKLMANLNLCRWNRLLSNLDPESSEYRLFSAAFESGAPFDFDAITSKHLLGKQGCYDDEDFKLLFLHHCNRSSKRFVKYA